MQVFKATLLAGAALVAMMGSSQALTADGGSISYAGATDYYKQIGNLSYFNPAAGTLTAVTFTAGYGFSSTITVTSSTATTGNASTESAANFQSSAPGIQAILNALINTATPAMVGSATLNPTAYDDTGSKSGFNLAAGATANLISNYTTSSMTYSVSPSSFNAFYAATTPSIDIYGQTLTGLNLQSTGGNASATQVTQATQNISLTYTYDAPVITLPPMTTVPEPASLALLGMGLIGLGAIRRKQV